MYEALIVKSFLNSELEEKLQKFADEAEVRVESELWEEKVGNEIAYSYIINIYPKFNWLVEIFGKSVPSKFIIPLDKGLGDVLYSQILSNVLYKLRVEKPSKLRILSGEYILFAIYAKRIIDRSEELFDKETGTYIVGRVDNNRRIAMIKYNPLSLPFLQIVISSGSIEELENEICKITSCPLFYENLGDIIKFHRDLIEILILEALTIEEKLKILNPNFPKCRGSSYSLGVKTVVMNKLYLIEHQLR